MFITNPRQTLSCYMKCLLIFHVSVEGLPTEDTKNILEKVLSECKNVSQHLEDLARKIQLQEDINAYFKQLNELEKTVKATEERVKHAPFSESPQRSSPTSKDSCQVKRQPSGTWQSSVPIPVFEEMLLVSRALGYFCWLWRTFSEAVPFRWVMWLYFLFRSGNWPVSLAYTPKLKWHVPAAQP